MKLWLLFAIPAMILAISHPMYAQGTLTAKATAHSVTLTCTPSTTPGVNYNLYRGTASAGPFTVIGSPTTCAFTDTAVVAGTTYFYQMTAFCPASGGCPAGVSGESTPSNQVSATIPNPPVPPAPPTGLSGTVAVNHVGTQDQVIASWSDTPGVRTTYVFWSDTNNNISEMGSPALAASGLYSKTWAGAPQSGFVSICDSARRCMLLEFQG